MYVRRPYSGRDSSWYKAAVTQRAGRITAAGLTMDGTFVPVDGPIDDMVDDAYRAKYASSPYLSAMIGERVRSTTIKIMPRR